MPASIPDPRLKTSSRAILEAIQWDQDVEFKGAYLFSRTKGCSEVEVERRVRDDLHLRSQQHSPPRELSNPAPSDDELHGSIETLISFAEDLRSS